MRKIFVALMALGAIAVEALGQGQISFQATAANGLIQYSTDDVVVANYPLSPGLASYGNAHIGFYTAPNGAVLSLGANGLPDFTGWTANTLVLNLATGPGRTSATTITVAGAANGVNVEMEVVGWVGTATSWAQAIGSIGATSMFAWSGKVSFATGSPSGALGWSQPTGDPTAPIPGTPAAMITGSSGYKGLLFAVPEPSAMALGIFGAGVLGLGRFFLRRRTAR